MLILAKYASQQPVHVLFVGSGAHGSISLITDELLSLFDLLQSHYVLFPLKPWPQNQDPQNREVRQQRFAHFTELAIMSVQEIVDFAKQLPGFLELTREDQIALLKTSTIEVS